MKPLPLAVAALIFSAMGLIFQLTKPADPPAPVELAASVQVPTGPPEERMLLCSCQELPKVGTLGRRKIP